MRLPLIPPARLSAEQHALYSDMRSGIETNFQGFKAVGEGEALIGPWNPWLHEPRFGGPIWQLVKALSSSSTLPRAVREVAILVTGAKSRSAYEIYAHVIVAEQTRSWPPSSRASDRSISRGRRRLRTMWPQPWSMAMCCPS